MSWKEDVFQGMEEMGSKKIHSPGRRCVPREVRPKRCSLGRRWALGRDGAENRMWAGDKTFIGEKVGPGRGWG